MNHEKQKGKVRQNVKTTKVDVTWKWKSKHETEYGKKNERYGNNQKAK